MPITIKVVEIGCVPKSEFPSSQLKCESGITQLPTRKVRVATIHDGRTERKQQQNCNISTGGYL